MLGEEQGRLMDLALEMNSDDGCVTIQDVDDAGATGFTRAGIDTLKDLIAMQKAEATREHYRKRA